MPAYFDETWKQWRYRAYVHLPNGKTVRISGTPDVNVKAQAIEAERDHILRTRNPPPDDPKKSQTFSAYAKDWLRRYPAANGNRPTVVAEKERIIEHHLEPVLGDMPLDEIKGAVLTELFADLRSHKLGPKEPKSKARRKDGGPIAAQTKRNIKMVLRRILASAVEEGKLPAIPVLPKVKVPKISDSKKWDWLRTEESAVLLDAAADDFERAMFMFAIHTGARLGEQLAIRWRDVDFKHMNVTIPRALVRGEYLPPKSGHGREVPMTAGLAAALKKIKRDRDLIFSDAEGKPLPYDNPSYRLDKALKRAELRHIRWHDLRHTFCSQLASAGVPLRQIQEWAGHSSITVTERYSHLVPGAGRALIGALDAGAGPARRSLQSV